MDIKGKKFLVIGGGGLIGGIATIAREMRPNIKIVLSYFSIEIISRDVSVIYTDIDKYREIYYCYTQIVQLLVFVFCIREQLP